MSLPLRIAWRYLRSKKTHNAVNVISIISICGVVVTTAAIVCVLSVFNGFHALVEGKLARLDPELSVIAAEGKTINNADSVIAVVTDLDGVQAAVPVVEDQALAMYGKYQAPVRLKGVPENYADVSDLPAVVTDGAYLLSDAVSHYAIVGKELAYQLQLVPNNVVQLYLYAPRRVGDVDVNNPADAFFADSVWVSGTFFSMHKAYDAERVYVPIALARDLFDYDTQATAVELRLAKGASEEKVMDGLKARLGDGFVIKNRLMQQAEAFRLINIEKWVTFLLLAFVMLIAAFNIISTLTLLIIEKDDSVATLRNLGASSHQVTRIFVLEGWLITLAGVALGVLLGLALCLGQQHFGWLKIGADPSKVIVQAYPVQVAWTDLLVVFGFAALVAMLTSLVTSIVMRRRMNAQSTGNQ